jgi:hypothetical protein
MASVSALESKLNLLKTCVDEASRAVAQDTPETASEASSLRDIGYRLRKLQGAASRPAAIGYFGPSQAGKSFLVGALLSHELGSLKVLCRGRQLDFLKEINPAKGVESTGVVSRFSTRPVPTLQRGDFYCRLLGLDVMLESMATGFLVECTSPSVDGDRVAQCLRDARLQAGPPAPAIYRDAWELVWHDLYKKYQDRHPYLNELRRQSALTTGNWKDDIKTVNGWQMIYSLLWGGPGYAVDLDRLLICLVGGLEAVGHAQAVEVSLEHVRASSDGVSIVDASCLNSLGATRDVARVFVHGTGREVAIEPGILSGLIAELYLPLEPVPGSLLDRADILDFPGGRALKGINGFGHDELNTGKLDNAIEVYKRGKLTFLFEQYALEREITALVLCSPGPTKPEAIQLQSQVEAWLKIRYGAPSPTIPSEVERPSLFLTLTKFDMSLGALRSDNGRERWESRVQEACVDFWARSSASWINNWGAKDRAFDNTYWIRNPYADQMQTLKPGEPDYEVVKAGYHEARAVRRHIRNFEDKWRAVEGTDERGLVRSGVPLLTQALRDKLAEDVKGRELAAEAIQLEAELTGLLKSLTPSKDETEERERVLGAAKVLTDAVQREMARRCSGAVFGELIGRITPPVDEVEDEIRSVYGLVAPMSIKASDKVKKVIVHILKWWTNKASERFRASELQIPATAVDQLVREVCTSRAILPVLGNALFPYFSRSNVDAALIANIVHVAVCDALVVLFKEEQRRTPTGPIRLSYSEVVGATDTESAIDWGDVDFDQEEPAAQVANVEIVFAGSRAYKRWSESLGPFYLQNRGSQPRLANTDPRVIKLEGVLAMLKRGDGAQA